MLCPDDPTFEFVLKGNLPVSALRPLTSLTGGGSTALDGIPTFGLQGGEIIPVLISGSVQWRAFDLTPAADSSDVTPVDNPDARWVVVGGL